MERLNPLDAQFVDAEDEDKHASFAIASIAVFEGPAPSYEEFLDAITTRLPLVPLYRRKLRTVPFRLGPPVWVDDPNFDLRYHVRHTALPAPGGDEELSKLMARVMGQRLDRDYPLWEYWLVEGLTGGRWALISKVHHSMVDGVSGTDLYRVIFDLSPDPPPVPPAEPWTAPPEPSALDLAAQAGVDMIMLPVREARALTGALADPGAAVRQAAETAQAVARLTASAWPAAGSSLSGSIGRQRRYTWARASLADVKAVKRALGGTVNDVVLAAISSGYRDLLLGRGESPQPHMVPSLVPVSMRSPGEENIYENRVSVLVANLPVHLADPVERLAAVRAELSELKEAKEATAGEALVTLGRFTPYPVASAVVRLAYRVPQREIVTVTTNVPGPRQPLYGMGRRLLEIIPYVPIATTLRTGVSIFSYCDNLTFGITGDYDTTPDLDVLARGIENGISELLARARASRKGARR
ncbi:MAG TPA: wax ester/triacylglycerol synthase family O-acyltransferase [Streptosporangiaceae bacterium]|nr:wax ester/triacylglycerol synthase family O-acyltransferase [Streptosporangiaceae bacterium]